MTDQAEPVHPVETETRHLFMATFTVEIEPNNDSSIVYCNASSEPDPGGLFSVDEGTILGIV